MESEPSPTEASSDEISNEKLINGEAISHVEETEKTDAEANLDVECRKTNAEGNSNDRPDSVVLPSKTMQEEDKYHQEPDISISSEERATVHSESKKQQDCSSSPIFSPESTENKEQMQVEETDSEAKKDQVVPELVHESKGLHGEAIDSYTFPGSTSETEGPMEEPTSVYASAEPELKETADVSHDEQMMVKSSNVEVDVTEIDADTGLIHPPTDVNLVETIEKNNEPETKIIDVEEPVAEEVNEDNLATTMVEVPTKVETAIENLEAGKIEDQSSEIKNENSLETINPVKADASAIEIEQSRELEAMITDDKQEGTSEVVVNLAIEAVTHMPEIPAFVIPTQSRSGSTLEIGPAEETKEKEIKDDKNDAVMEIEKQCPSESTNAITDFGIYLENKKLETKPEDGGDEAPKEVGKDVPNESSHATSAFIATEETCEVEADVAKQFPDESTNDTSSIGVDEEIKEIEVELAVDTQEAASEVERELQTDCSSATLAAEVEENREVEAKVEKQFPDKSISDISSIEVNEETKDLEVELSNDTQKVAAEVKRELEVDVEETRKVEVKVEKRFPADSTNATSSIGVDEETKDLEVELEDNTPKEATEVKRELQTDSTFATSANIKAKEATDIGVKIEDEEQEALTEVGKQFPAESSSATSAVEVEETSEVEDKVENQFPHQSVNDTSSVAVEEETKEPEVEFEEDAQEEATEIKRELQTDSIFATSAITKAKEATDTGAKIEDEEQEALTEVGKQFPDDSSSATSAVEVEETSEVEDRVENQFPRESVNDTLSVAVEEETKETEVELAEDAQEEATEIKRELQTDSIFATSAITKAKEATDTGAKIEDEEQEALAEVGKQIPNDSSSTSSAVEVEETGEVVDEVGKQFSHESVNDTSSIGVEEETKDLEVELAEDAQEEATEIKRELQTDFIVATSAIMNAEEATEIGVKIEDEEQDGLTNVGKEFPADSSSACSAIEVEENREVDAKVEKQFADDSSNAISSIRVDEETKDLEVELEDDTQEEATEVKRELQTNSRDATSTVVSADEAAELGAKIEDEEQEALTKVGKEFPSDSSCAALVVEVDKEASSEFTSATLTILTAEGTKETEATAADDKKEVATEVEKQCRIDSCSATLVIGTDEEARQLEANLADDIREVATEVEKVVSTESADVLSAIVTADKAKDVEDKIEDDKQEEYIKVEKQIPGESSTAVSAIGTNEETRKQEGNLEDNKQEAATELEKEVPTESRTATSTIVVAEKDREVGLVSGTEVETPIPSESGTATPAIGTDEETRELEVKFADDKTKDGKQEVAEEVEEPVPSNSGTSTLASGTPDEIRGPEAELADENQGANGAEMQVSTEFSGATSAILTVEETTEIEDDNQGAETEVEKQVPSDSITTLPAPRTYEGTREPEVPIADDKQEEVTEVEKIVPTVLNGIDTFIIKEETRELEGIIEDGKRADKEVEDHVPSESSRDNAVIVETERSREIEAILDDDKQDTAIVGEKQTHGDSSTATLVATDEQKAAAEVKNEVPTDSCGSISAIATSKELTETEVSIMDGYQEAAKEVEKQVPSDYITARSGIGTNEETCELDVKLADNAEEVEAVAKHVPTESVGDSSSTVSAEENTEAEAQTEDDEKAEGRKLEQVPETDEETKRLEVKLEDYKQPTDFEEVPSESSDAALVIATAMETKELEAKIEDDSREEVEKQVQSESTSTISSIGTIEEARELEEKVANVKEEGKTVTEKQVLIQENEADATSEIAQVFIDKEKDILLVEMVDDKDNSLDNLEIHTDIGNLAKEDAIDISVPESPTDPKTHETSSGTSVILCGDETKQSKVEALNEKQDIAVEIKEPSADETNKIGSNAANVAIGAAEETTEIEFKVVESKQEAAVDIVQQVPSDSIIETSAIETAEETRKLEAEILEDKQREATVVDKQVANQANEIYASSEIIGVSIKEENDIVIVEMVDGGHMETTKLAKEDASYIGMPEAVTNVRANQSPIATSVVPTSYDEFTQPKLEVIHEMQERALEIEEPSMTEINRSESASVSAEVPLEEETSHGGIENIEDKKEDILDAKTSTETSGDINVAAKISEIAFEGIKSPKDDEMVRKNNDFSQIIETDNENSKVDTIIIVESFKNLDNGTQIDDASLEGNRISEGGEMVKNEQKEGNVASSGITEISTELGKSPDVVEEIEETNGGNIKSGSPCLNMTSKAYDIGCGEAEVRDDPEKSPIGIEVIDNESKNLESKTMLLYETTKLDDENAEISNILSEENKVSEGPEVVQDDTKEEKDYKASMTRESKDDNIESKESYIGTPKDLDVEEVIATATSGVTELLDVETNKGSDLEEIEKPKDENLVLAPKSADVNKIEESPRQEISAKSSPRRSNNIISKVKHSIVKAKKAIMGKSPTPKDASPSSKEIK